MVAIIIHCPSNEFKESLQQLAYEKRTSLSQYCIALIEQALETELNKPRAETKIEPFEDNSLDSEPEPFEESISTAQEPYTQDKLPDNAQQVKRKVLDLDKEFDLDASLERHHENKMKKFIHFD